MTLTEEQQNAIARILYLGGMVERNIRVIRKCDCKSCTSAVAIFELFKDRISSIELMEERDAYSRKIS